MTDSEILAGIDGLFLARKIAAWINNSMRLRLSQVLDMYYSNRGLPFLSVENSGTGSGTTQKPTISATKTTQLFTSDASIASSFNKKLNKRFRTEAHAMNGLDSFSAQAEITSACSRRRILESIDRDKLKDETYFLSQVLQFSTSSVAIADRVLRLNCDAVVDKFFDYSCEISSFYLFLH